MIMSKLENFLKQNASSVPVAPSNEWAQIVARIENSKNLWDLIKDTLTSKPFWLSAGFSTACALVLVVKLSGPLLDDQKVDDNLSQVSQLYSEDLQIPDSDFLE